MRRVVKYLKGSSHLKLVLSNREVREESILCGYTDASWAENSKDRKSNSGYVIFLYGGIINWSCRKQNCVSLSSTEAEYVALAELCQEIIWIKELLKDFDIQLPSPIILKEDNQSCLKIIENEKFSYRSKHIDTKLHFIKDYVKKNIIKCEYCPTEHMLADLLTKPLRATRLKYSRECIGLRAAVEEEC